MKIVQIGEFYKKGTFYKKELALIKKEKKFNGMAYIVKKIFFNTVFVIKTDFATVRMLRKEGFKPNVLSVSGVLYYKDSLLLHKRSLNSDTYPEYFHLFGGGVESFDVFKDIKREILEESGLRADCKKIGLYFEETGIISIVFKCKGKGEIKSNWEGEIYKIKSLKGLKLTPMAEWVLKLNSPYRKEKHHHFTNVELPFRLRFL